MGHSLCPESNDVEPFFILQIFFNVLLNKASIKSVCSLMDSTPPPFLLISVAFALPLGPKGAS